MKKRIDFIIDDDLRERLLFRFYPRRSRVYGFHDEPPKTWDVVYKTYFSYAIIKQYKNDENSNWDSEIMYEEDFDECSCIQELSYILKEIINSEHKSKYKIFPHGDGTSYNIAEWLDRKYKTHYQIMTFQSYTNKGYRFSIKENQLIEFAKTIDYFLEYMLKHSEGI